jgi:hypothetical protein
MTSEDFEELFELVRWEQIARFMREAKWGWIGSPNDSPTVVELQANVRGKKESIESDPRCIAQTGGGFSVRRSRGEEGRWEWEILFDISTSQFWPEGWS